MKQSNLRVVITGASSGIGAATAIEFARRGAHLVLGARGKAGLEDIAERCRRAGGTARIDIVDVTDAKAVAAFAQRAQRKLGQIDLWFSDVGIGVVGKFHEVPIADHQRVIDANLVSHMNEAHAVVPIFLAQGRGTWVNMISVGGFVAAPYATAYSASKFALRGFSAALRGELRDYPDIHVCDVYPTFVDTPGFAHAGNYTGSRMKYPPGALAPETVARAVVRLARHPRDTTAVGAPAAAMRASEFATPITSAMKGFLDAWAERGDPAPVTTGSLYAPPRSADGLRSGQRPVPASHLGLAAGAAALGLALGIGLLGRKS